MVKHVSRHVGKLGDPILDHNFFVTEKLCHVDVGKGHRLCVPPDIVDSAYTDASHTRPAG